MPQKSLLGFALLAVSAESILALCAILLKIIKIN
ncbi:hypothetical protein F383_34189 [Gossypium arboreum]|uniref:Uncharacterized protein n=1 Tax=Gossypium arboreum TaxID=29729 RepID=A0A0B0PWA2_GOSAR|nr:hypothetical protein F383_34189 [Gossypium arboreum]